MPPLSDDPEQARPWFAALRELRDRLEPAWRERHAFRQLSMGTSQDYQVAAQEGATIVRVGSVLYGG
jgi:PLP dependent protein